MQLRIFKLERENNELKNKEQKVENKKEDEELTKVLKQIKEMEKKEQLEENRRHSHRMPNSIVNPIGINFHHSDVIDLDPFAPDQCKS